MKQFGGFKVIGIFMKRVRRGIHDSRLSDLSQRELEMKCVS
jgi:hypothetical protein